MTIFDEFSEIFQMASDPPTLFSENNVALFATKFFGVQRPHPISLPKKAQRNFSDSKRPPPFSEVFRKFIEFGPRSPLNYMVIIRMTAIMKLS